MFIGADNSEYHINLILKPQMISAWNFHTLKVPIARGKCFLFLIIQASSDFFYLEKCVIKGLYGISIIW